MGSSYSSLNSMNSTIVHVSQKKIGENVTIVQLQKRHFIHIGDLDSEDKDCIVNGVTLIYFDSTMPCRQCVQYEISFKDYQCVLDYVSILKKWVISHKKVLRKIIVIQPFDNFKTLYVYIFLSGKHSFPFNTPNMDVGYVLHE